MNDKLSYFTWGPWSADPLACGAGKISYNRIVLPDLRIFSWFPSYGTRVRVSYSILVFEPVQLLSQTYTHFLNVTGASWGASRCNLPTRTLRPHTRLYMIVLCIVSPEGVPYTERSLRFRYEKAIRKFCGRFVTPVRRESTKPCDCRDESSRQTVFVLNYVNKQPNKNSQ